MIRETADILDADGVRRHHALTIERGRIIAIDPLPAPDGPCPLICPGLVDLQVNGGGGMTLNTAHDPEDIQTMAEAHQRLGTSHILPTLISDTPETTARIIDIAEQTPGLPGLHLEGPHLAIAGAHDPALLRPMEPEDLALYLDAARRLPGLMMTLAPEMADADQIRALSRAGIIVALGHTACTHDAAQAAFAAGARMVTHLFNAMSGLHHREPGLVGATLDAKVPFGIIADGHHVHDAALRLAYRLGSDRMIPVSDAMALTGSDAQSFSFQGRDIHADGSKLTLADGTLAGARASLLTGLRNLARVSGRSLAEILALGFDRPWQFLGHGPRRIAPGQPADLLKIHPDGRAETLTASGWQACHSA